MTSPENSMPPTSLPGPAPILAWAIGGASLGLYLILAVVVALADQAYFPLDLVVSNAVQSAHAPGLETLMHAVSMADNNVAGPSVMLAIACGILALCRAWKEATVLLVATLLGQLLWVACGKLIDRPRPDPQIIRVLIEADNIHGFPSFPSGHTVYYTVFFGFLWYLAVTRVRIAWLRWPQLLFLAVPVLLVGFARVFLGAHWITDVIGGYLLGAAVLACGIGFFQWWTSLR